MNKKLWYVSVLIAVCTIVIGIIDFISVEEGYKKGQKNYRTLQKEYVIPETDMDKMEEVTIGQNDIPDDAPQKSIIAWDELIGINQDIVAWIDMPAVGISYPVVQGDDNEYYLHHSVEKEYLFAGSIFMDYMNNQEFLNYNTILYGHNMNDGSMFTGLKEYSKQEVYDAAPYFWIYTPKQDLLYQIFNVSTVLEDDETYCTRFLDYDTFVMWLQKMKNSSDIQSDVFFGEYEHVVTLSTCTGDPNTRRIVQGIRIN